MVLFLTLCTAFHDFIIVLIDYRLEMTNYSCYHTGSITIALEYMDGGSLANVLNQVGPIPEKVLASIAYQILWGLAYLKHEKRVHRDMKPSNLLINSQGEVKV
jgi:serine/threonine protein kinase